MFVQVLDVVIAGLLVGGLYALIAMGLSLQYGVARVLNIAHGEFIMLGALTTWSLYTMFGINPLIGIVICGPIAFILGFIIHRTFVKHLLTSLPVFGEITIIGVVIAFTLYKLKLLLPAIAVVPVAFLLDFALRRTVFGRTKASPPSPAVFESNSMLFSFGLLFIIQNIALVTWGPEIREYTYLRVPVSLAGALFGANRLITLGFALTIGLAFYLFLARTRLGKAIRAAAQDPSTAGLLGVNIDWVLALCFGFGTALAAVAGTLISLTYPVHGVMGLEYTIIAIIVVVLGGLGSIPGSFIGGLALGLIGSIVTYFEPGLALVAYYAIFILLLLLRPTGIMGR